MSGAGPGTLRRTEARAWAVGEIAISPKGLDFLAYWHSKCPAGDPGRRFPRRDDIHPEEIVELLPYIFMVDVLREDVGSEKGGPAKGGLDFRFRLVGTAIVAVEGEITGRLMSEMFPGRESYRVMWQQYLDAVQGEIRVRRETLRWQDREHVNYEVILAPLEGLDGRTKILIGIAHAQED